MVLRAAWLMAPDPEQSGRRSSSSAMLGRGTGTPNTGFASIATHWARKPNSRYLTRARPHDRRASRQTNSRRRRSHAGTRPRRIRRRRPLLEGVGRCEVGKAVETEQRRAQLVHDVPKRPGVLVECGLDAQRSGVPGLAESEIAHCDGNVGASRHGVHASQHERHLRSVASATPRPLCHRRRTGCVR